MISLPVTSSSSSSPSSHQRILYHKPAITVHVAGKCFGEIEHLRIMTALDPEDSLASVQALKCATCTPRTMAGFARSILLKVRISGLSFTLPYMPGLYFGMIETPYAKVKAGKITKDIQYLNALEEENFHIAHAAIPYDKEGNITDDEVEVRINGKPGLAKKENVDYIDVSTNQAFSVATSLIPFLNDDAANRALMGSNMQKQATPCLVPEAPPRGDRHRTQSRRRHRPHYSRRKTAR